MATKAISYVQAVKRVEGQLSCRALGVKSLASLTYEPSKSNLEWLEKCLVGTLREHQNAYNFQDKLCMQGLFAVNTIPMGGNQILLAVDKEDSLREIIEGEKSWFSVWFDDIKPWNPDVIPRQRDAWLRVFGVPLHVWEEDFFQNIVANFGTYLSLKERSRGSVCGFVFFLSPQVFLRQKTANMPNNIIFQ